MEGISFNEQIKLALAAVASYFKSNTENMNVACSVYVKTWIIG